MGVELNKVVPLGRSDREYELMLALFHAELSGPVLGIWDGPASLNAEMTQRGCRTISVDPILLYLQQLDEAFQRAAIRELSRLAACRPSAQACMTGRLRAAVPGVARG